MPTEETKPASLILHPRVSEVLAKLEEIEETRIQAGEHIEYDLAIPENRYRFAQIYAAEQLIIAAEKIDSLEILTRSNIEASEKTERNAKLIGIISLSLAFCSTVVATASLLVSLK